MVRSNLGHTISKLTEHQGTNEQFLQINAPNKKHYHSFLSFQQHNTHRRAISIPLAKMHSPAPQVNKDTAVKVAGKRGNTFRKREREKNKKKTSEKRKREREYSTRFPVKEKVRPVAKRECVQYSEESSVKARAINAKKHRKREPANERGERDY